METLPTNHGEKTIPEIMDILAYSSYKVQRDNGLSYEICAKWYKNHKNFEIKYQQENK